MAFASTRYFRCPIMYYYFWSWFNGGALASGKPYGQICTRAVPSWWSGVVVCDMRKSVPAVETGGKDDMYFVFCILAYCPIGQAAPFAGRYIRYVHTRRPGAWMGVFVLSPVWTPSFRLQSKFSNTHFGTLARHC